MQGAIGSELKIDATYLSPHVEMSDRLEAASKIFGAKLNMSHWLVNLMSPTFKKYIRCAGWPEKLQFLTWPILKLSCARVSPSLRPVDCITAEGVPVPVTVWTYDVEKYMPKFGVQVFDESTGLPFLTNWDMPDFAEIQKGINASFMPTYKRGFSY